MHRVVLHRYIDQILESHAQDSAVLPLDDLWDNNADNSWESLTPRNVYDHIANGDEYAEAIAEDDESARYDIDSVYHWMDQLRGYRGREEEIPEDWNIFVDSSGEVIDGYHRLTAAMVIGLRKYPQIREND